MFMIIVLFYEFVDVQDTTMTVTKDGNVGVGTTIPIAKLHIMSDGGFLVPQIPATPGRQRMILIK